MRAELKTVEDAKKIAITSLQAAEGSGIISATDSDDHEATIAFSVSADGVVSQGTITPYSAETVKSVSKIEIDTTNTKTEYVVGSELVVSLTVTYDDETSEKVTTGYTSDYKPNEIGTQTVTISYGGQTATLSVTVKDVKVTNVEKTADATQTTFKYGEAISTDGLALKVTYNDGSDETVTSGFTVTGYSAETIGEQSVTISYGTAAEDGTNSITYKVTVENYKTGIEATLADGVTFAEGDTVKASDVVVQFVWANGDKTDATVTTDYTLSPTTALTASDTKITVTPTDPTFEAVVVTITVTETKKEVSALWDFATAPTGVEVGTKITSVSSAIEIPAVTGSSGATLKLTATADTTFKTANDYGTYIAVGKNTGSYTDLSKAKATLSLELQGAAKLGLTYSGSGNTETSSRWIVIKNAEGTEVWHDTELSNETTKQSEIETALEKGTYTIYLDGFYLYNLYATNGDFTAGTKPLTDLKSQLNLTAISEITSNLAAVATVAKGDDGDSATITAVKPGFVTLTATDGANHFAKIPVTVGIDGTITVGTITKNSFAAKEATIALTGTNYVVDDELSVPVTTDKLAVGESKILSVKSVADGAITLESVGQGTTTLALTVSDDAKIEWKAVKVAADGTITVGDPTIPFLAHDYSATLTELGFAEADTADTVSVTPDTYADYITLNDVSDSTYRFATKAAYSGDDPIVIKIPNNTASKSAAYITVSEIDATGKATVVIEKSAAIEMESKSVTLTELNLESIAENGLIFATDGDNIASAEVAKTGDSTTGVTITAKAAGTTTLTVTESDGKTASIAITVAESGKLTLEVNPYSAAVTTTTLWNASNCTAKDYTENTVFAIAETTCTDKSKISGFSVTAIASETAKVTVDSNNKTVSSINVKFTQRLKLNNPGSKGSQAIKFTLTGRANVTVYFISGSKNKTRTVHIATDSADVSNGTKTSGGTESVPTELSLNLDPGDYYIYGTAESGDTGGVNIYGILVKPPVSN